MSFKGLQLFFSVPPKFDRIIKSHYRTRLRFSDRKNFSVGIFTNDSARPRHKDLQRAWN
jgi:hypothetical protein